MATTDDTTDDPHAGKTVSCFGGQDGDHDREELTFEKHGRFVSTPPGDVRDRFESSALRFDCPECERTFWVCPVCSDESDRSPGGWIDSENERGHFEQIPCHNCNQEEVAAQRRRGY